MVPHPFTRPEPIRVPEDTKLILSSKPAGQTVPVPMRVAEPVPSPQAVIVAADPVCVKTPLVTTIVPQPTTVGAHPDTVPDDATPGNPKGARYTVPEPTIVMR